MKVLGIGLKEVGPYEEATTFKIKPGLSVIYGLNQSAGKNSKNSNYVGKSLLFSTLAEVLYEEPLVGSKQDRIQTGTQQVILEANNKVYQITKKNNKYSIKENGQLIDYATKTKATDFIKTIWPLSFEEYETFVHIDSRIAHPLVMGSTAIRKDFFTKFFGLDKVDAERKLYLAELTKLKESKKAYDTLKSTLFMLSQNTLSEEELDQLKEKIDQLSVKLDTAKTKLKILTAKSQLLDLADLIKPVINQLEALHLSNRDEINALLKKYKYQSELLDQIKLQSFSYTTFVKLDQQYKDALKNLSPIAKQYDYETLDQKRVELNNYTAQKAIIEKKLKCLGDISVIDEPRKPQFDQEKVFEQYYEYQSLVKKAKQFEKGICPTCGQEVKDFDYPAILAKYEALKAQKASIEKYECLLEEYQENAKQLAEKEKQEQLLQKLNEKIEELTPFALAAKEHDRLPKKPQIVEKPRYTLEECDRKSKILDHRIELLEKAKQYIEKIQDYWQLDDKTKPDVDSLNAKVNEASNKYYQYKSEYETGKKDLAKLASIKEDLKDFEKQLEDVEPLNILIDLYQDKNLKKKIVQIIGNRLMQLVNRYASQVFTEDYRFELDWSTSQINILCTRNAGKRKLVSDVRKLSGAESRLFTIILLLALMSFIPTSKRPNVIIMDEADANLSSETIVSFQKLLALLLQVVESIIIITPRSEDFYPNATNYTIVRNGTSKIVEAHPSELVE